MITEWLNLDQQCKHHNNFSDMLHVIKGYIPGGAGTHTCYVRYDFSASLKVGEEAPEALLIGCLHFCVHSAPMPEPKSDM